MGLQELIRQSRPNEKTRGFSDRTSWKRNQVPHPIILERLGVLQPVHPSHTDSRQPQIIHTREIRTEVRVEQSKVTRLQGLILTVGGVSMVFSFIEKSITALVGYTLLPAAVMTFMPIIILSSAILLGLTLILKWRSPLTA